MIIIPAIFSLLCLVIYLKKYKLKDKYYKQIMDELKERKEAEKASVEQGLAEAVYAGDEPVNTQAEYDAYEGLADKTGQDDGQDNSDASDDKL